MAFDNYSLAIALLSQAPEREVVFEYVAKLLDSAASDMNYSGVTDVLNDKRPVQTLAMQPDTLVLFRG